MKMDCFSLRSAVAAVVLLALLFAGCETKKQASEPGGSQFGKAASTASESSGEAGTGDGSTASVAEKKEKFGSVTFAGMVKVTGTAPSPIELDISAKPECGKQRQALELGGLPTENLVVGAEGGLKDCIVFISKGLKGYKARDMVTYGHPAKVVIDQKGCQYVPHVFAVMADQEVVIRNSDPFLHNVSIPTLSFNLSMPGVGEKNRPRFFNRKMGSQICQCSVHPWMNAYAYVVKNPFFSKTGADGKFTIGKLPDGDGTYTVEVWHERDRKLKAPKAQKITVKDGAVVEGNIVFEFSYKG
tara:strand:+ start:7653 stop:8552 length:900 start_codon:yes stop_codon:yes gene_type:complete